MTVAISPPELSVTCVAIRGEGGQVSRRALEEGGTGGGTERQEGRTRQRERRPSML